MASGAGGSARRFTTGNRATLGSLVIGGTNRIAVDTSLQKSAWLHNQRLIANQRATNLHTPRLRHRLSRTPKLIDTFDMPRSSCSKTTTPIDNRHFAIWRKTTDISLNSHEICY
jgi:hypothetical protein